MAIVCRGQLSHPARVRVLNVQSDTYAPNSPKLACCHARLAIGHHSDHISFRRPGVRQRRHNLAAWTGQAGHAAGARDQYAALLPIRERVLGPQHPGTLTTRHNLAAWTARSALTARVADCESAAHRP